MKKFSFLPIVVLTLVFAGCSTQKNTFVSRSYHDLTAHYNVYFNGNESYKKGVANYNKAFRDDYSRILPVYNYGNKDAAANISSEMGTAQKKASKLITLHSIKVKPKMKRGKLTPKEKEILNTSEFNKWVDDAYLLIGKSNFYIQDYDKATEAFNFTVREFPKDISFYKAQIWIARVNIEKKEYRDAEKVLNQLETDRNFPPKLKLDYYCTGAHCALKQEQYAVALKLLVKALPLARPKAVKLRISFIMAQLYQQLKRNNDAMLMYNKVIRKNPPYEMAFNAQINLASLVQSGSKDSREVKQQLLKLAKNEKNKDYLDQIYYAIGNIEMNSGNENEAIENYKKSVVVSKTNADQKALSCLTLADYFYAHKNYVSAQAYYDSTMQNIRTDYPTLEVIKGRAASLGRLVDNLNIISTQDSLQKVAQMSENERNIFIDKIIANLRQKELDDQMAESQRLQDYYSNQSRQVALPGTQGQAKWYFYNPVSITQGAKDFQLRWGRRRLEDNWRRKNKASGAVSGDSQETLVAEGEGAAKSSAKKASDNKSRDFYTQNLPLTDSLMVASKHQVIVAYFDAGQVYRNELMDIPPSAELYEEMLRRFPDNEYKLPVLYQLYLAYREMGKNDKSDYYKNLILNEYPTSTYAQVITNPEYYKQVEEKDKESERFYEQTYSLYEGGNYAQVVSNSDAAIQRYPNDRTLPNFALLKALSMGKTSDLLAFREELNRVIEKYPNHAVATHAKEVIAFLNNYKPETKLAEDTKKAEIIYSDAEASEYYFVLILNKSEDLNQVSFDIINFNLDNFSNDRYEVSRDDFGKELKIVSIRGFKELDKVRQYYSTFTTKPEASKNVKGDVKIMFFISADNYSIMLTQKNPDSYVQFFRIHYIENNNPGE